MYARQEGERVNLVIVGVQAVQSIALFYCLCLL